MKTHGLHMHSEVAKLLEAGRINQTVAKRLSEVAPGSFLFSKSWGAGKVVSWSLRDKKVFVDFANKQNQEMDLQFVMQKTESLEPTDFRAKKLEQIEELRALAKSDAVELAAHLLESHGGSMTLDAFEKELCGGVFTDIEFKKWWETAKKLIQNSKRIIVPVRRTDMITLRGGELSPAQALVADFENSRDYKSKSKALEAIAAETELFKEDPEAMTKLFTDIDADARRGAKLSLGGALDILVLRDQIAKLLDFPVGDGYQLAELISSEHARVSSEIQSLTAARQRQIYDAFPAAFGETWVDKLMAVVEKAGARGLAEIAKIFDNRKELPALEEFLRKAITRRSLGHEALIWVCREREGISSNVFSAEVGAAILNQLESDFISDGPRKAGRLQSLLSEDKELLTDLVGLMDVNEAKNFARRLLECPVFSDLDKKSLMARVIKARPETNELVSGGGKKKEELLVSWESMERKKNELEDMVRNRIPQNTKDISIARSYGDLRENFEYKSAKEMQKYLMHRKTELERDLHKARGTDFNGADASAVNIGTVVTLGNDAGKTLTISVLGAWDSDPEKSWVSYLSEAGAELLGKKVGDAVQLRDHDTELLKPWTVQDIKAFA